MLAAKETKKGTIVRAIVKTVRVLPACQRNGSELNPHPIYLYLQYLSQTLNRPNPKTIEINCKISQRAKGALQQIYTQILTQAD